MPKRKKGNTVEKWEVAIIKAMLDRGGFGNDQDILAYFTRPTRSINHRIIAEIRKSQRDKSVKPASSEELDNFIDTWPDQDPKTGLSLRGDELLIKAREGMIAAVHIFNSAGLFFRAEIFIVTAIIAWTYLLHSWFKKEGIAYKYKEKTPQGAERYWELGQCLTHPRCPLTAAEKRNLEFLIEIRHEIEHRSTNRIDFAIGAELQSCCINFNKKIKELFGPKYGLDKQLHMVLQFVSFDKAQRIQLKKATSLPPHVATFIDAFEHKLTEEELSDPAFRMRVAFIPITSNRQSNADKAVKFIDAESAEGIAVNEIFLKEVSKKRFTATEVVKAATAAGYPKFSQYAHTNLWKQLQAKDLKRGYGCKGDYKGTWVWYENWVSRVLEHCKENAEKYS